MTGDQGERARRIGLNEALFREVNERVTDLAQRFDPAGRLALVCECGAVECAEGIRVDRDEYELVRADPRLFMVLAGHELEGVEDVVERRAGYVVVRKREGEPAHVAESTDPRS
jgi:hypothetical protein